MSYQPSTYERLMASRNKTFSRMEDLGKEAKMFSDTTSHNVHDGLPYVLQTEKRQYSRGPYIANDEPIGDVNKVRSDRDAAHRQQMKILAMSMNPKTIRSNV